VYAVDTIDQGIEILTDMPAGERDDAGRFPATSVNGLVEQRLATFASQARAFRLGAGEAKP
jgi:hypothetical protein